MLLFNPKPFFTFVLTKTIIMKSKTLLELLTLSSNLYLIAKDKDLLTKLSDMAEKGKKKVDEVMEEFSEDEDHEGFIEKLIFKAQQAKEELDKKMEEVAVTVYKKMNIAHTSDLTILNEKIDKLKNELELAKLRITNLEGRLEK